MLDFNKVAVVGFSALGAGIAQVVARSDRSVIVLDTDPDGPQAGVRTIAESLDRSGISSEVKDEILGRIVVTTSAADLADAQLVIEALIDDQAVKSVLLTAVAAVVSSHAVIATTTSTLSVSALASAVPHPERFAGLHFFEPASETGVVEVVQGLETEQDVLDRLCSFTHSLDKEPVVVKDRPGFLVNRLLMPYLNDVIQAYDDELASAEDIDLALKLGLGYKRGPLELLDDIGLDEHERATRAAYESTLDSTLAPPPLLQAMVAAGMLGAKNGKGFRTQGASA